MLDHWDVKPYSVIFDLSSAVREKFSDGRSFRPSGTVGETGTSESPDPVPSEQGVSVPDGMGSLRNGGKPNSGS
jgi:hypothetical protein